MLLMCEMMMMVNLDLVLGMCVRDGDGVVMCEV